MTTLFLCLSDITVEGIPFLGPRRTDEAFIDYRQSETEATIWQESVIYYAHLSSICGVGGFCMLLLDSPGKAIVGQAGVPPFQTALH